MKKKKKDIVVLDVGCSNIVCVSGFVDSEQNAVVHSAIISPSKGLKAGSVNNSHEVENSAVNAIYSLEKKCNKNIKAVNVCLPPHGTNSEYISSKIIISDQHVSKNDIHKLTQKAIKDFEYKNKNHDILHHFPIEFSLDKSRGISNPEGMIGKELGCKLHVITTKSNTFLNFVNCLNKAQVEIEDVVVGTYASGLACLNDDEKEHGSLVIDCGGGTTSFGIFLNNKLLYSGCVPIGSAHISSDISKAFAINFATAEKIKILYGKAIYDLYDLETNINVEDIDPKYGFNIKVEDLAEVVTPRVDEILELVKKEYDRLGFDSLISKNIVLTGGGSLLSGLAEKVHKIFNYKVRVGVQADMKGLDAIANVSLYSSALGALKYLAKGKDSDYNVDPTAKHYGMLTKIFRWLKQNV